MSGGVTLFVYGSLLRGQCAHAMLAGARFLGAAQTPPEYELVSLGEYPALLDGGRTAVFGELYEVPESLIAVLDEYEDHPDLYRRRSITLSDGRVAITYQYEADRLDAHPRIPSGDWRDRAQKTP